MRLLAILFAATSLFGAQRVFLDPVAPTSVERIALRIPVSCQVTAQSVQRTGSVIHVSLTISGICDPPVFVTHIIDLEPLPPGEYRVEVTTDGIVVPYEPLRFVVRNGARAPFVIHPSTVLSFPAGLRLWITPPANETVCPFADCHDVSIRIGNTNVTNIQPASGGAATFDAPALPVGLYDVTLRRGDVDITSPAAVYVFEDFEVSIFERLLFPVLDSVEGQNGSRWVSEAIVSNPRPWFVENGNSIFPFVCVVFPCGSRLSPRERMTFQGMGYPHGAALLASRLEAREIGVSLRVRDVSREADGFGTELPVVREKDMFRNTTMTLLGVPRDPRYRVKVRMYALDPFFFEARQSWRVVIEKADHTKSDQSFQVDRECSSCPDHPAYLELDLPPGATNEFSTVYITAPQESFAWAFASVTNNVTQQVTIVTPNGKGGEP
jgi:hypothetical protein